MVGCDGGRGGEAVMGTHCTWAVVFVRGQWARRSFTFVSGRLRTRVVGGRTRADDGGCGGYRARARGGAGCHCGRGRVLVVWLPHHPWRRGPCIRCERKKGEGDVRDSPADGDDGKHRHRLDDVAHCHVVACTLHRLSAVGDGDVALVLGVLTSIVAGCCLGSWLGVATSSSSSSYSLVLVVSGRPYTWALVAVGSGW